MCRRWDMTKYRGPAEVSNFEGPGLTYKRGDRELYNGVR